LTFIADRISFLVMRYNHKQIEKKWQERWGNKKVERDPSKPKYYVLDMFPYPSGSGLHVGHVVGYTATDIVGRYKEMKGFDVLHPMGWDAFGLPAEQYAIRTGTHPRETTKKNIATYKRQLSDLGLSYDWSRELSTTDPEFYKWTQWIFTKLYERGLAYEAEMLVNYCPKLGTVLANEEVENGLSKEGKFPVERRPLRQWVLKITEYADRLLKDLDLLDWPENIKQFQRQWIGRSEGVKIQFPVVESGAKIEAFTTRPDTLYGVTFLVVSPEHPLIEQLTTDDQRSAVEEYRREAAMKSDFERTEIAKEKTGVFTGSHAINPINGEKIPVWCADYVLAGYGTGAVMAVPIDDERDKEFAWVFQLPIKPFDEGEIAPEKIADWLEEHGHGKRTVSYKLRDWLFSRQRYWGEPIPILHLEDGTKRVLDSDELPLIPPDVENYKPTGEGMSPLAAVTHWVEITDPKTGKKAKRETNTMPQWGGSCWYYLRFCDPRNNAHLCSPDAEKRWLPVDLYIGGAEHAVLHLLYARFWHKVLYDIGVVSHPEPFHKLFNQGLVTSRSYKEPGGHYVEPEKVEHKENRYFHSETGKELESRIEKMSKSRLNVVNPDEIVEDFGADSLRLYEMFMGPLDKEKQWNTDGVNGCRRFLQRFWELAHSDKLSDAGEHPLAHRLAHDVAYDIEALHFNTAIAKMMEFVNAMFKEDQIPKSAMLMATQILAPFAPHLAHELWEHFGQTTPMTFPTPNPQYLTQESVTYIVQVNGKLRGRFDLPKDQDEATIIALAKEDPNISKHLEGKEPRKTIFVPNRLINFVL
jgi:leucyl-tRNA synthetase